MYTDGAAKGNPGPGGYGVVLLSGSARKELAEGFRRTTNNRMELLAVIKGLEALIGGPHDVLIYSDSKYVVDAIEKGWLKKWVLIQFKGKKNSDLWMRYLQIAKLHRVRLNWVKGHANIPENERCDRLAVQAAEQSNLKPDSFFENEEKKGGLF
jgi:ribonuclease HI